MGGISQLFQAESRICWSSKRCVWFDYWSNGTVHHLSGASGNGVLFSIIWREWIWPNSETSINLGCWQGQYHFVYILAPKDYRKFAAFLVGWMNLLGWTIATCSGVSVVIASVSGMASFWDSSFQATQSQLYMMYLATIILTCEYSRNQSKVT